MKQIIIDSLELHYFKKTVEKTIKFDPRVTNISAYNRKGKTTIFDAFTWLLFGKDSLGNSVGDNFDLKTLDSNNNAIPDVEHTVEGVLLINGVKTILKKSFVEDWTGKRGGTPRLTGHHNECWYNGVPVSVGDYTSLIDSIIPESLFKLLTNPLYFNSLNKTEKRAILIELAGDVSDAEIANGNDAFMAIIEKLEGRTRKAYQTMIKSKKDELDEQLKKISTRIDEQTKTMPESEDWAAIELEIKNLEKERDRLQDVISSANGVNEAKLQINKNYDKLLEIQKSKREILDSINKDGRKKAEEANRELYDKRRELQELKNNVLFKEQQIIDDLINQINKKQSQVNSLKIKIQEKSNEWSNLNAKVFETKDCLKCPVYNIECRDSLALEHFNNDNENAASLFNSRKAEDLNRINTEGKALSNDKQVLIKDIEELESKLKIANDRLSVIENQITTLSIKIEGYSEVRFVDETAGTCKDSNFIKLLSEEVEIKKDNERLNSSSEDEMIKNAKTQSNEVTSKIQSLIKRLNVKDQIKEKTSRIHELEQQKINLAQEISQIEKDEDILKLFERAVSYELQARLNDKFRFVKFRLFKENIGEGDKETCDTLIDGVPYNSTNSEAKINAGIDIINALQERYETYAPIWIDNRESVIDIEPTKAQLINFIVSFDNDLVVKYPL